MTQQPNEVNIEFFPETHSYLINGEKAKISVTSLIEKQIAKTDWAAIDPTILQRAADRGTKVHSDLEHFIGYNTEPTTDECRNFSNYLRDNNWKIEEPLVEFKLAITHTVDTGSKIISFILSGTADLICKLNGKYIIVDHKTTSTVHEEYVRWQMSILDYMARQLNGHTINGKLFTYHPAEELYCFHFDKQAKFTPVQVTKVPDVEIERLLDFEAQDLEYVPTPIDILTPRQMETLLEIEKKLCSLKAAKTLLDNEEAKLRSEMEAAFRAHPETKSVELPHITLTYKAPSVRETFDTEAFSKDYPELYRQYIKQTSVKDSVTIKLSKELASSIEAYSPQIPLIPPTPPEKKKDKSSLKNYFD